MSTVLPEKYILYAEDDVDDQLTFKEMITDIDSNIEVIMFNDGLKLMHYLDSIIPGEGYPCCVVLDVNMPIQDGIATLHQIRKLHRYREIPVIMFSTSNNARDLERAHELGATAYITKPSRASEFTAIAERFSQICTSS